MTKENFASFVEETENTIKELRQKLADTKLEYIANNAKFSVRDKVLVINNERKWGDNIIPKKETEAFIKNAGVNSNGDIYYSFLKCKKDGTQSSQGLYMCSYDEIKLIKPSK